MRPYGDFDIPAIGAGSYHRVVRVLVVEDEPYLAEAIRDGLRLEAIAADTAGDGDTALELLSINAYDIAVLDRDIPGSRPRGAPNPPIGSPTQYTATSVPPGCQGPPAQRSAGLRACWAQSAPVRRPRHADQPAS